MINKIINKLLSKIGFSIVRLQTLHKYEKLLKHKEAIDVQAIDYKGVSLNQLFGLFKSVGFAPKHIIDVGAHKGGWTRELIKYYPLANYTLLEPQLALKEHAQDLLTQGNVKWLTTGAGCNDEKLAFTYVERADSRSFIYSEKQAKERGLSQEIIEVHRLDTIVNSGNFGIPEIVKIDAEGLDLEVLIGLGEYLGKVEVIFVEVALANKIYKNTLEEVVTLMYKKGYKVFDVTDLNRPFQKPVLWLMELVFVKSGGLIDKHNWRA